MNERLIKIGRSHGMEMNVKKNWVMGISRPPSPIQFKTDKNSRRV
jgi:hypothetical protein